MPGEQITVEHLEGVFAVPPLPRRDDRTRSLDFDAAERIVRHIASGGVTRFMYGGNAFLYHVTLAEFEALVVWLAGFPLERWVIPSIGPAFGRALDQAHLLRRHRFRCAMVLPCSDPRDALGMEAGLREIADSAGLPLILYLKSDDGFGSDANKGLDAIGRLVDDGVCVAIKYAVVRGDPRRDSYLEDLSHRVDRRRIISGMGERPAVVHLRDFGLRGFTTGSGCIAPRGSNALLSACLDRNWSVAESLRAPFMPLEDLRDAWGPARVLHHAIELAEIAPAGPIPPYVSPLESTQLAELAPVARSLRNRDSQPRQPHAPVSIAGSSSGAGS
jgi:dihydrodipicolinate synthase/N-acetylneuraminate lyase